jgi:tryptophan 2,3-dioxygenase
MEQPSLSEAFWSLLSDQGFAVAEHEERIQSIVQILTHPEKHGDLFVMQDLMIEHDENIALWRYHHVLMVERMLGMKPGTGGSEGVGYLMTTLKNKFYPELWEARTHLKVLPPALA